MGKIFDALEKFTKESGTSRPEKIKDSDYEVLMKFDESTGKIDVDHPEVLKDAKGVKRLMTYRLINDNGTLTPAGRAKYEEMKSKHGQPEPAKPVIPRSAEKPAPSKEPVTGDEGINQADWALLMNYDRQTGNLLKYDPATGQLDEASRNLLQDPATVQRLIDNQMILPGGWLTPEAKQQCVRMKEELEEKQPTDSATGAVIENDRPPEATESLEALSRTDMEILLQHDPSSRKLNLNHPAIVKDPTILKRLQDNKMLEADGKLTPQALVRCRALMRFKQEFEQKAPLEKKPKSTIAEKLKTVASKNKEQKDSDETAENKLKIISLKKDKAEPKKDKAEQKPKNDKAREITHDLTTVSKPQDVRKIAVNAAPEKKFTMGGTPPKYARREIEKELVTLMNPHSFEAEQFKILRTNLLFAESGKTPRSIMVTSTVPGEGKSFVAANLAISVAQHVNWNVLLIDCDLRRPSVHRQFGYQNVAGLSEYLTNGSDLEPLLLKTGIENLTVLPAGSLPDNPSELLSSERMAALLDEVANRYKDRLIILDSPPPKLTAESTALARYVDGILLVVKYGSTPKDQVSNLISKLGRKKIVGAVINNFDAGSTRYHKKYYGGDYLRK